MNNLGTIYFNRGEYERAMPLFTVCILCILSILHPMSCVCAYIRRNSCVLCVAHLMYTHVGSVSVYIYMLLVYTYLHIPTHILVYTGGSAVPQGEARQRPHRDPHLPGEHGCSIRRYMQYICTSIYAVYIPLYIPLYKSEYV